MVCQRFAYLFIMLGILYASLACAGVPDNNVELQKREYLKSIIYSRQAVSDWLEGEIVWGELYHPVLGWIHNDRIIQHGIDESYASYHYDAGGERRMMAYADLPCRINTYGNSFTSCEQVNDGETWQEYLALHLKEPVRNFGIGGYSVYQSYRRMLIEEKRTPASYIIFNVFSDDHYRNLTAWRNIRLGITPKMRKEVSCPTLPYIKANPSTGLFVECENPCPTAESFYNLCEGDWVYNRFKDNFALRIAFAKKNINEGHPERSYAEIDSLAKEHGLGVEVNTPESLRTAIDTIFTNAGIFASMRIVEKVEEYAARNGAKVLYVLSYQSTDFFKTSKTGKRFDQEFIDFLDKNNLPYVDLMQKHLDDFAQYRIDENEYARLYWIGHYSPRGNFFHAYSIKDELVELLDPKPLSYSPEGEVTYESPWEGGGVKKKK